MYNNYYDSFVYEISSMNRYSVTKEFPALTRDMIPNEIVKVSYTLDLSQIKRFKI